MTKYTPFQAALIIQLAWRDYYVYKYTCPYCDEFGCPGFYSIYRCPEEWPAWRHAKQNIIDHRFHD